MNKLPKNIIPIAALIIGLIVGLGIGQIQIKKEQKVSQDKVKEANRKIAFIQKKVLEEKSEAVASVEQKCQRDLDKLDKLQNEKKTLEAQLVKSTEQAHRLEMKVKESDEANAKAKEVFARTKKETDETAARTAKKLQETERTNKDLDREVKKITGEKQTLQAELKKKAQDLGRCASNNAELCSIAEDLLNKYKHKGLGAVLMEKEPITQIKKVELEKLSQQYREEIEQQKIKKSDAGVKNVTK